MFVKPLTNIPPSSTKLFKDLKFCMSFRIVMGEAGKNGQPPKCQFAKKSTCQKVNLPKSQLDKKSTHTKND
jgi:hypothetical protein